jgi:hypothetical protein
MSGLIKTYCQMTVMLGPLTTEQIVSMSATTPAAASCSFFLLYNAACLYLENLGVWLLQSVESLTIEDLDPLLNSVGQLFVDVAERISKVILVDEVDSNIGLSSNLPPVLPCELTRIDMRMFPKFIQNHCLHLVTHFYDSGLEQISQKFCECQHAFYEEENVKKPWSSQMMMLCQWISSDSGCQQIIIFHGSKAFVEGKLQHSLIQLQLSQIFQLLDGKKVMIGMI